MKPLFVKLKITGKCGHTLVLDIYLCRRGAAPSKNQGGD
jgi:hypothetical protein